MLSPELKEKNHLTLLKNHGVTNPMLSPELKEKCINNMIYSKFNNFINNYDLNDNIISWSGINITLKCSTCDNNYSLSRELLSLRYHKDRVICTNCNPLYNKNTSYCESDLRSFLNSINIDFKSNDRTILNGKELDIYIPSHNLAIEFNGLYWHSELFRDSKYHLNKTEECEKKGVQLIHIFEDEWKYKKEIVQSRIKNILGLTENRVFARKCDIKKVSIKHKAKFLDDNHIQGTVSSKYNFGLFYNDELISLMTFGKGRIAMGGHSEQYELSRFCNKLNTNIIGGASKLLKYFIKNYKPKEIISYADRRWSQGDLYQMLNFNYTHSSKPNYWYVVGDIRKHRFGFRKNKLVTAGFDLTKTEREIMLERGIYRIYDSGSMVFKFKHL